MSSFKRVKQLSLSQTRCSQCHFKYDQIHLDLDINFSYSNSKLSLKISPKPFDTFISIAANRHTLPLQNWQKKSGSNWWITAILYLSCKLVSKFFYSVSVMMPTDTQNRQTNRDWNISSRMVGQQDHIIFRYHVINVMARECFFPAMP